MEYYFDQIKPKVLKLITEAEFVVFCAVAWITDYDVINALIEKSQQGVKVELLINDDEKFAAKKMSFLPFIDSGGKLYLYPQGQGLMHNKFCVIDLTIVITGSFNWTYSAATKHEENIVVLKDDIVAAKDFARQFNKLKRSSIVFQNVIASNNDSVKYYDVVDVMWMLYKNNPADNVEVKDIDGKTFIDADYWEGTVYVTDKIKEGWFTIKANEQIEVPDRVLGYWGGLDFIANDKSNIELWSFYCTDRLLIKNVVLSPKT